MKRTFVFLVAAAVAIGFAFWNLWQFQGLVFGSDNPLQTLGNLDLILVWKALIFAFAGMGLLVLSETPEERATSRKRRQEERRRERWQQYQRARQEKLLTAHSRREI